MSAADVFGHDIPEEIDDFYYLTEQQESFSQFCARTTLEDEHKGIPAAFPSFGSCFKRLPTHWRMKDGKLIAIKDMTIRHLRNTKALIERNAEIRAFNQESMTMLSDDIWPIAEPEDYLRNSLIYKAIRRELSRKERAEVKWPEPLSAAQILGARP